MLCPKCGKPMAQATMDGRPAWYCHPCGEVLYRQTTGTMDRQPSAAAGMAVRGAQEATTGNVKRGRNKFGAVRTEVDGISFHSRAEANRYKVLKLMEAAGEIVGLSLQPSFDLAVNGQLVCRYRGDFEYTENGARVIEDCKGMRTPTYRLKCKLMRAVHGIEIRETTAK